MRATIVQCLIALPDRTTIGDRFTVTGDILVIGLEGEQIDVTSYGGTTDIAIGETAATLFARLKADAA